MWLLFDRLMDSIWAAVRYILLSLLKVHIIEVRGRLGLVLIAIGRLGSSN